MGWIEPAVRAILGLAFLVLLSFGCVVLWVAYGPWAGIAGGFTVALLWACWDKYVLKR